MTRTDEQDVALLFEGFRLNRFFPQTKVNLVGPGFCLFLCSFLCPSSFPGSEKTHLKGSGVEHPTHARYGIATTPTGRGNQFNVIQGTQYYVDR
jgi:hypothetical protein